MRYDKIDNTLFIENRKKMTSKMAANSVAILYSNDKMPRSGDTTFPYRQNGDFFYLSGIDQEESILLLYPDCIKEEFREVLFIKKTNEFIRIWEGAKLDKTQASEISGISKVIWLEDMEAVFNELILLSSAIYLNLNENDRYSSPLNLQSKRKAEELRIQFPLHKYERLAPIMKELTMQKSLMEIALIKSAVNITAGAFNRVLEFVKPGVKEYEVEAEIIHEFIRNRANGHAYEPIIATGKNACILHYIENTDTCEAGDLLLMDFGAEYANYASDLTRTIPVSGRFTERQKAVYNAVLETKDFATTLLKVGLVLKDYEKEVGQFVSHKLIELGLLDKHDLSKQGNERPAYKKYFMHGTSHHMGIDVHDKSDRYTSLKEGMVLTCEPGIYIPHESIGIRIENDIVITNGDPLDLMKEANIPESVEAIEEWMNG